MSIAGPLAVNTLLYKKLPYDPARDLEPVTIAATQASVVVDGVLTLDNGHSVIPWLRDGGRQGPGMVDFSRNLRWTGRP